MEFSDHFETLKNQYAYVEMPIIILFTIPKASYKYIYTSYDHKSCTINQQKINGQIKRLKDKFSFLPMYDYLTKRKIFFLTKRQKFCVLGR